MSNNLTEEYKKKIHREYIFRYLVVLFTQLFIISVIGVLLLAPAFISARVSKSTAQSQLDDIVIDDTFEAEELKLQETTKILTVFSLDKEIGTIEMITEKIVGSLNSGVTLTTFSFTENIEIDEGRKKQKYTVSISGTARSRNDLIAYKNALEKEDTFEDIDLPVSNLAKDTDVPFNISFKATTKTEIAY